MFVRTAMPIHRIIISFIETKIIMYICIFKLNSMKQLILLFTVVISIMGTLGAQPRDRRVDLEVQCGYRIAVSTTGQLWLYDRCGHIWKADSIGATWRTMMGKSDDRYSTGPIIESIAAFGPDTALAAGYMHDNTVLRTTTGGHVWDFIQMPKNHTWVHGLCYHPDGKLWMASASGRSFKTLSYSNDRGMSFSSLKPSFPDPVKGEDGIEELFMVSADSGFAGTYGNRIYSTSDNWRTVHRIATPQDQGLVEGKEAMWVTRIRQWRNWLIATQNGMTAYTMLGGEKQWKTLPISDYETDPDGDRLWAITDSGQLVLMRDMERWTVVKENPQAYYICGVQGGCVYIKSDAGVVRIAPNGKSDTCGFFTEEESLQDFINELVAEEKQYGLHTLTSFKHGGRQWLTDHTSIYMRDILGWYRIAKPDGIVRMVPDPDHDDRVIILSTNHKNYTIDSAGRTEDYTYSNPFGEFLRDGLSRVAIETYSRGCFHYSPDKIVYKRNGDILTETEYTVKDKKHKKQEFDARKIEDALRLLGEKYSLTPTAADFGLREGVVDLEKVFNPWGGCTTSSGYSVTLVNRKGDILTATGSSDVDCGDYFPMLLPMFINCGNTSLVTYRPELWNALKPLMPEKMFLTSMLSKYSLMDIRPCDLLFFRDTAGMGSAVQESTGEYTHVAIVETIGDSVWVIDATPSRGVSRHTIDFPPKDGISPDIYRLEHIGIDIQSTLERARSLIGRPYDNAFMPGTKALYCSELIYECYLRDYSDKKGEHIFKANPMNWRDANGQIPQYWIDHFGKLGIPVPEGVSGTNPTDMSKSPFLKKL